MSSQNTNFSQVLGLYILLGSPKTALPQNAEEVLAVPDLRKQSLHMTLQIPLIWNPSAAKLHFVPSNRMFTFTYDGIDWLRFICLLIFCDLCMLLCLADFQYQTLHEAGSKKHYPSCLVVHPIGHGQIFSPCQNLRPTFPIQSHLGKCDRHWDQDRMQSAGPTCDTQKPLIGSNGFF